MDCNKKPPEGGEVKHFSRGNYTMNHHALEVQRQRLLAALRNAPVTTTDARQILDILHPCGRVMELRRQGHNIVTTWVRQQGHRVDQYSLLLTTGERPNG